MAVRLKDIARELGVSTVTVSKVLRGHPDIGERTRALVLQRMRELNYRPNMMARGLASGRSDAVGLVVPDLVHPFFGEFARSVGAVLRQSGRALVLASSEEDPGVERQEILALQGRGIDVLLLASCESKPPEEGLFGDGQTPVLLVDRNFPKMQSSFVGSDDVAVGAMATRHLLTLGRNRIAHIGGEGMSPAADRLKGYRAALAEAGTPAQARYLVQCKRLDERGDEEGYRAMRELLSRAPCPDAVFCYNDMAAIGAMKAAMEAGLQIPADIAFVGCGNLRFAEYLKVPLTSIDHNVARLGEIAAEVAMAMVTDPATTARTVLVEPRLIVRQSSIAAY